MKGKETKEKPRLALNMRDQDHTKMKPAIQDRLALLKSTLHQKRSDVGTKVAKAPKLRTSSTVSQRVPHLVAHELMNS